MSRQHQAPPAAAPPSSPGPGIPTDATIDAVMRDWTSLMTASAGWHARDFLSINITMAQAKLLHVAAAEPATRMSSLAARLGVSLPTLSGLVDRLVTRRCLERRDDPQDRRRVMVAVTPHGSAVMEQFSDLGTSQFRALLATLPRADLCALARGIAALAASASQPTRAEPSAADPSLPPSPPERIRP